MSQITLSYQNPLKAKFTEDYCKDLPTEPGVYYFLDRKRKPLYIGKADCLRKRLRSYFNAKPGQTAEHILEMIELAQEIVWELHATGEKARLREAELIRSLVPPFNISGTSQIAFLYCGLKAYEQVRRGNTVVDFRLSHHELDEDFETFGCFLHRGKTKSGYSAVLRLLYAVTCEDPRFHHLPSRLCRSTPAYVYRGEVPEDWLTSLTKFLRGESPRFLNAVTERLLQKDNIPPYLYAPLQRDLKSARIFFETGPKTTRSILKKSGRKAGVIAQHEMVKMVREKNQYSLQELLRRASSGD